VDSLDIPAARYAWQAVINDIATSTTIALVAEGVLDVVRRISELVEAPADTTATGFDARSFARRMLDAIEARLEGTADRDDLSYSTEGLSVSRYSPDQLEERRNHYRRIVVTEERLEAAKLGNFHSGRIFTRLP